MTRAVFLGRFQPMHKGHYRTIENYREEFDLVIAIGSPEKSRTDRNPLTFEERKEIIDECFPDLEKVPVEDEDRGEEGYPAWGQRLVKKTGAEKVISRNDTVIRIVEQYTDADIIKHGLHEPEKFSGTRIRRKIRQGEEWKHLVPDCSRDRTMDYDGIIAEK